MKKVSLSSGIGTALEWYDFAIYGYFTQIIGLLLSPKSSSSAAIFFANLTFAFGFLARPLGAIVLGRIGDSLSRKKALMISIYLMTIPTVLIGCLPTYEQIGIIAPIALFLLRTLQGFAIGGEFTGAMIFLVEHSPKHQRGFYGSIATSSAVVGTIIGSMAASLVLQNFDADDLHSFGWRIPFILSGIGGIVGSYIRSHVSDPENYLEQKKLRKANKITLAYLFKNHSVRMLHIIILDALIATGFFTIIIYFPLYCAQHLNFSARISQHVNTASGIVFMITTLLGGVSADKFGAKKVMIASSLGFILLSYPLFSFMQSGTLSSIVVAQFTLATLMGGIFGALPVALTSIFPVECRFSGISLAHNVSMAIFGGTIPLAATALIAQTKDVTVPAFFLIIAAIFSLVGAILLKSNESNQGKNL